MKATGVIRRIDELGRIVIPKEIRNNMRINDGENIEIYISDNETIVLKKYSTLENLYDLLDVLVKTFSKTLNKTILITDRDKIKYVSKGKFDYLKNQNISNNFFNLMESRKEILSQSKNNIKISSNDMNVAYIIKPLIINGDLLGSIVILNENELLDMDIVYVNLISSILVKYIEK